MTVYRPGDDSRFMAEYLEEKNISGKTVLDMGTGSGVLAMKAAEEAEKVVAADIQEDALDYARKRAREKEFDNIEFVESDLFENIEGKFDLIVFNPPYLPGREENRTWGGGETGVEVTERFLESAGEYLEDGGEAVFLASDRSEIEGIASDAMEIDSRKIWFETLYLLKIE